MLVVCPECQTSTEITKINEDCICPQCRKIMSPFEKDILSVQAHLALSQKQKITSADDDDYDEGLGL